MGEEWKGGDMSGPGGGYKINLLKEELANHKVLILNKRSLSVKDERLVIVIGHDRK